MICSPGKMDLLRWTIILASHYVMSILATITPDASDLVSSACFSQPSKVLPISCDAGHMINLRQVYYGYSASGSCNYTEGDCYQADDQHQSCSGQHACAVNLPTGELGRRIPSCNEHSTYMQVHYTCVPVSSVYDICEHAELTAESGYISSPRYPHNYPHNLKCKTTIRAHPIQTIALHVIDLDFGVTAGANCTSSLYVQTQLRAKTLCGTTQQDELIRTLHDNKITVTFESGSSGNSKGFWLFYQASPPLPPTTSVAPEVSTIEDTHRGTTEEDELPSQTTDEGRGERTKGVAIEAIVGGVLGALLIILLVILILLIIKRRKERRPLCSSSSSSDLSSDKSPPSTLQGLTGPYPSTLQGLAGPYIQNDLSSPVYTQSDKLFTV